MARLDRGKRITGNAIIAVAGLTFLVSAQGVVDMLRANYLHGNLPDKVVYAGQPYVVDADVYVPPGATVVIDPGVVLLFNNFTGVHVQGTLIANGTQQKPVVFSSLKDKQWNPASGVSAAPYDWNGLDVYPDGVGTRLTWCSISYSVYGIRAQTPRLRLESVQFRRNGKADFTVEGEKKEVESGKPFSYGIVVPKAVVAEKNQIPVRRSAGRSVLRYSGLACAVAGCAVGVWGANQFAGSDKYFRQISANTEFNQQTYTTQDWENAKQKRSRDLETTVAGFAVGVLCAIGFGVSFAF